MSSAVTTWELTTFANLDREKAHRKLRFDTQNSIRNILVNVPDRWRVTSCLRNSLDGRHAPISIGYHGETDSLRSTNLITCGSVWLCPVCATKIMAERADKLAGIIRNSEATPVMVTLTIQHKRGDRLKDKNDQLRDAYRYMFQGNKRKLFSDKFGALGYATGREVRWGEANGWHPHMHLLLLCKDGNPNIGAIEDFMYAQYGSYLKSQGLLVNDKTIDVKIIKGEGKQDSAKASADYLTKSVIEMEIAGGHGKGSKSSYSPFQLATLAGKDSGGKFASLFVEYAKATKGNKMFTISRSLLQYTDEAMKKDSEIAEETEGVSAFISLQWYIWRQILDYRLRAEFFSLKTGGRAIVVYMWLLEKGLCSAQDIEDWENEREMRRKLAMRSAKDNPELWERLYGELERPETDTFVPELKQLSFSLPIA